MPEEKTSRSGALGVQERCAPDAPFSIGRPSPPLWVRRRFEALEAARRPIAGPWENDGRSAYLEARDEGFLRLLTIVVEDAASFPSERFEEATTAAYAQLLSQLASAEAEHTLRVWNFIPRILEPVGRLPHRYMTFNAGRCAAYEERYGSRDRFPSTLATSSGTGHSGSDLVIHCLASPRLGRPLENPRQTPSYRYSERYGPSPPCFARATLAVLSPDDEEYLLVGGTASVKGEDSTHPGDLLAQLRETTSNLEALLAAACAGNRREPLSHFRHLRVYYPRSDSPAEMGRLVARLFEGLETLEYIQCDLCRPELLVEIEGLAEL